MYFPPFSPLSHCWLIDSGGSSPDPLQGRRRHAAAHLWGVSDNNPAHALVGWLVPALPRGDSRSAAGAGHPLQRLCPSLWGDVPPEDGSGGPEAGQNQRHSLQTDYSQAAANWPGPALLPGCRVDSGHRWHLVCNDPQTERQDSAPHSADWWVQRGKSVWKRR